MTINKKEAKYGEPSTNTGGLLWLSEPTFEQLADGELQIEGLHPQQHTHTHCSHYVHSCVQYINSLVELYQYICNFKFDWVIYSLSFPDE